MQGAEGRLRKAELLKETYEVRLATAYLESNGAARSPGALFRVLGTALVLPTRRRRSAASPDGGRLSDREIERIAVEVATRYEMEVRRVDDVKSVEADNVGFDLLSLRAGIRRCIEVKGRAGVALVELTWGEFAKAQELGDDYWLYVVLDCATPNPRLYRVQDPARALATAWTASHDVRFRVGPEPGHRCREPRGRVSERV